LVAAGALASLAGPAAAQQRVLTVRVLDSASDQPIRRAAVEPRIAGASAKRGAASALAPRFTDARGLASFGFASDDSIEFTVRSIGFASSRRVVQPQRNDTLTLRVARIPVRLDAIVATAVDNNCPSGMGRAADQVDWQNVTNALAIAADYEAESNFSFEVRSFQRQRTLGGAVTDASEIIETSPAAPSIFAQSADWLAANGFASREGDAMQVEVPSPSVLASPTFEQSHCFIFAGDSERLVRLRFAPLRNSRVPDVSGEMLLEDETLAPVAVQVDYAIPALGDGRERATLAFDRSQRGTTYLRELSLELPLFVGNRVAGTMSQGQHIQLLDSSAQIRTRGGGVRVEADCGTLALQDCLERGNAERTGSLNGVIDPLRALAYYGAVCRAGPSPELARAATDTTATTATVLALINAGGAGVDSMRVNTRRAVLGALSEKRPDQLSATQRSVFAEMVQLDGCAQAGLALGRERDVLGARSEGARTATLVASCMADEGLACLWVAPAVAGFGDSSAGKNAERILLDRACALEVARACRGATLAPETIARSFLTQVMLPPPTLVQSYASLLAEDSFDQAMTDVEVLPGGLVETISLEGARARASGQAAGDSAALDRIAGLLRGNRELRALMVLQPHASSAADPSSHDDGRQGQEWEAAQYEDWFRQHGVAGGQVRVVTVPDVEPATPLSTLLGRQFQKGPAIAIRVPGADQ